jgi:hypothetical protein
MTRTPSERAKEIARLWQGSVVPIEDEAGEASREERVIPALGAAIARAQVRRSRERSLRRLGWGFAAAASVALALGIGGRVLHSNGEAHFASGVDRVSGTVTLVHDAHAQAVEKAPLAVGDHFSTASDATAEVWLTDLVRARIASSSEVAMITPRASTHRLRLDRGEIRAQVDDHPSATPKLVVETPNVDVVVTGTILQVDVTPGSSGSEAVTTVAVTKGRVVIRRDDREIAAVTAGQSWTSAPRVVEAPPPEPAKAPVAVTQTAPRAVRNTASSSASESQPGTLGEENRLFQAAVEARNRGADSEAITRFTELLGRFPRSPLAAEARVERMRALRRAGLVREATREAARYLADYPDGFARDEATRLTAAAESAPTSGN